MEKAKFKQWVTISGILLLTFVTFSIALNNQFTHWDDNKYIIDNPAVYNLSWQGIAKIFTDFFAIVRHYTPLTTLSWAVEYHFFQLNPKVYIFNNIILHLLNTLLVFILAQVLTKSLNISAFTAILFGIHPMRVESVVWIAQRKDLLYSAFFLAALLSYTKYCLAGNVKKWLVWTYSFFLCSLLSKTAAIILPVVLIAVDDYFKKKNFKQSLIEKIPFFILSAIFGYLAWAQKVPQTIDIYSAIDRVWFGSYAFVLYFVKSILPMSLCAFYPYPDKVNGVYPYYFYASPLAAALLAGFVCRKVASRPYLRLGFLFYVATILLVSGFIPMSNALFAEHNTYIPYLGLFFMVSCGYEGLMSKKRSRFSSGRKVMSWVLVFYLVIFMLLTRGRILVWENGQTLWSDALTKHPKLVMAYVNRGNAYALEKEYEKALRDYNQAISLNPYEFKAYINRGYLYFLNGQVDLAIADYNQGIAIYPRWAVAYFNRALAYAEKGQGDLAIADYTKILELNPRSGEAYAKRGKLYLQKREYEKAIADFSEATSLGPLNGEVFFKRSLAHAGIHDYNNALKDVAQAMGLGYTVEDGGYLEQLKSKLEKQK